MNDKLLLEDFIQLLCTYSFNEDENFKETFLQADDEPDQVLNQYILFSIILRRKQFMVKIRLRRLGKKKAPFYRIVVADSRSPRDGRFIEEIGTYDPTQDPSVFKIDEEAAKKWLANGAQPTDEVAKLLKIAGLE